MERKLVSDLTEMRKRKRHTENPKCEENKNNGTHAIQVLNEQTMSTRSKQELINIKIQHRQCPKYPNTKLREILKDAFTPKQIERLIFKNEKRIWWEYDYIAAAVTLPYLYLRKNVGLPVTELSTIRKWTRNLKCLSGIQKELLSVLKGRSLSMSSMEHLAVLSFDEMRVDYRMCYDLREDRIMDSNSNAQVIIARGLASKWRQPIFYDFDKNITEDKLFEVMKGVEESGFKVLAIVRKSKFVEKLTNFYNKVSFTNLVDVTREVWLFADIPHLIKLLRNNFLDYGIRLPCGSEISKWQLQQILHDKELSLTPKLDSRVHLNVSGSSRQKVKYATQLFSHHTATLLKIKIPQNPQISKFFDLVDKWFDVMNSTFVNDFRKPWHSALSIHFQEQAQILEYMKRVVENMSCLLNLLFGLYNYFVSTENLKYAITCHVNQDVLG
ncbi:hypothetical protein PR048_026558 [Dryococelus australis]|uniref:Transposase n=1 Tax=Dryococelus australis TaxID=614101 RepID=A0ABQ9GLM8_9NEOP|nr:hypothetical protein PR048_026558 [Dryococelus australis]